MVEEDVYVTPLLPSERPWEVVVVVGGGAGGGGGVWGGVARPFGSWENWKSEHRIRLGANLFKYPCGIPTLVNPT